jgi:hypothetical protein
MINRNKCKTKCSLCISKQFPVICLDGMKKTINTSVNVASFPAEIRIKYLRNTTHNPYHLSHSDLFSHILKNVTEMNGYVIMQNNAHE